MSNAPERKEGTTAESAKADRRRGLKLVPAERGRTTSNHFTIEIDDNLLTTISLTKISAAPRDGRGPAPELTDEFADEDVCGESTLSLEQRSSRRFPSIAAFAIAGMLIGYFFGKHR